MAGAAQTREPYRRSAAHYGIRCGRGGFEVFRRRRFGIYLGKEETISWHRTQGAAAAAADALLDRPIGADFFRSLP